MSAAQLDGAKGHKRKRIGEGRNRTSITAAARSPGGPAEEPQSGLRPTKRLFGGRLLQYLTIGPHPRACLVRGSTRRLEAVQVSDVAES